MRKRVPSGLLLLCVLASVAFAGDDYKQTVAYTGVAACSTILPKASHSVRCTTNCYVMTSINGTTDTASVVNILVGAGKMYDIDTTYDKRFICVMAETTAGNAYISLRRGKLE